MTIELTDEDLDAIERVTGMTPIVEHQEVYLAGLRAGIERAATPEVTVTMPESKFRALISCVNAADALRDAFEWERLGLGSVRRAYDAARAKVE